MLLALSSGPAIAQEHFRWPVKTLTDSVALNPDTLTTTVQELASIDLSYPGKRAGRMPEEKQTYRLTAILVRLKNERQDGDLHLTLRDPLTRQTVIGEIPAPVGPYAAAFAQARRDVRRLLGKRVTVIGVLFQDKRHKVSGRAVNGIELHPILSVQAPG